MKKGFTLVELSIVLVIIGLLIGGILVAQSMVTTTKTQATIRQLQQLDIAINNFKTKYNALPGDNTKFPGVGRQGDNDGLIMWGGEVAFFWSDLSQGVGLNNQFNRPYTPKGISTVSDLSTPEGEYTPSFNINRNTILPPSLRIGTGGYAMSWNATKNYYQYLMPVGLSGWPDSDVMTPTDTLALDVKLDDGFSDAGKFRAHELANVAAQSRCRNGSGYNVSTNGFHCSWELELGGATGSENR